MIVLSWEIIGDLSNDDNGNIMGRWSGLQWFYGKLWEYHWCLSWILENYGNIIVVYHGYLINGIMQPIDVKKHPWNWRLNGETPEDIGSVLFLNMRFLKFVKKSENAQELDVQVTSWAGTSELQSYSDAMLVHHPEILLPFPINWLVYVPVFF